MKNLAKIAFAFTTVASCAAFAQTGTDEDQARRERNMNETLSSHHVDTDRMSDSVQRIPQDLKEATHHAADKTREETHKVAQATRNETHKVAQSTRDETHKVADSNAAQSTRDETHKVAQSTRDFTHRHLEKLRSFSARQDAAFQAKNNHPAAKTTAGDASQS
jgi:hypothetical protein